MISVLLIKKKIVFTANKYKIEGMDISLTEIYLYIYNDNNKLYVLTIAVKRFIYIYIFKSSILI